MTDMGIGKSPYKGIYQSKYRYAARYRHDSEPECPNPIDTIDISMMNEYWEHGAHSKKSRSYERNADPERKVYIKKWEQSYDNRAHPIGPSIDDTGEYDKK